MTEIQAILDDHERNGFCAVLEKCGLIVPAICPVYMKTEKHWPRSGTVRVNVVTLIASLGRPPTNLPLVVGRGANHATRKLDAPTNGARFNAAIKLRSHKV